ncbi:cation acetate symporter [Planctellipticum variicoloris]|uniref:sodium/solute symporter n=1 Tax=Planctellipticum variicoloris TaxID=3064265 RepID=UPI003013D911|nr:cation acetate symporter [Planctomycetaceae bacterium SH412]
MIHEASFTAVAVFAAFVALVLGLSFWLGSRKQTASSYFAAHGEIHWFVNGVAFAGDYLSAASFLGICGMIAFYGYDGFLYSIGYLAGWIVALFVIAEPLKRLGKYTFADALNHKFQSPAIKVAAGLSALVVSIFYLIPQMVGAGALVQPLLGFSHAIGVLTVGVVVILIVVTAGMVSTTWVQFIKGGLLVFLCTILTVMILQRGFSTQDVDDPLKSGPARRTLAEVQKPGDEILPPTGTWKDKPYLRIKNAEGQLSVWRIQNPAEGAPTGDTVVWAAQTLTTQNGQKFVNGLPQGTLDGQADFYPTGHVLSLAGDRKTTGPLGPLQFFRELDTAELITWGSEKLKDDDGAETTVYYPRITRGADVLLPGGSPTFSGLRSGKLMDKLDFLSLMLALFCGTASLPHILIRYYTVKNQAAARLSTVVGIASIGFFYVLTLYLGLGAMASGALDVTNSNMAAPLLARSFGELPFAVISAVAFTTVLGTVSGLIMAASGAVAHDLLEHGFGWKFNDHEKVRCGKIAAVVVGVLAMILGILFKNFNVTFLVGWAFNIAASANLPALIMLLFWKGTTRQGITTAILFGMASSLGWVMLSAQAFKDLYGYTAAEAALAAPVPFSQPGLVTIPLGFVVLVVVSLLTRPPVVSK